MHLPKTYNKDKFFDEFLQIISYLPISQPTQCLPTDIMCLYLECLMRAWRSPTRQHGVHFSALSVTLKLSADLYRLPKITAWCSSLAVLMRRKSLEFEYLNLAVLIRRKSLESEYLNISKVYKWRSSYHTQGDAGLSLCVANNEIVKVWVWAECWTQPNNIHVPLNGLTLFFIDNITTIQHQWSSF